jgi:protein phosphatase
VTLAIPRPSLVVLIGPSGAGKSTFARRHFKRTEVVSSDFCRGLVSDDENDQSATESAFEVLRLIAAKRLSAGRLTVIDATNVQRGARQPLLALAREYKSIPVAVVFDLSERVCLDRDRVRPGRSVGPLVVQNQIRDLHATLGELDGEGFASIYLFKSPEEVDAGRVAIL